MCFDGLFLYSLFQRKVTFHNYFKLGLELRQGACKLKEPKQIYRTAADKTQLCALTKGPKHISLS